MTRELLITYDYTTDDLHKELQIIFNYTLVRLNNLPFFLGIPFPA